MRLVMMGFGLGLTLGAYFLAKTLYMKYRHPLLNVVLLGATLVAAALLLLKIPYQAYVPARSLMMSLLGPATVGLAVPLYRNRDLLSRHAPAILAGVGLGTLTSVVSVAWLAAFVALPREVVLSLLPKSVTIPFALEVVRLHGGSQALASAFVVATGTLGSVFGGALLTRVGVQDPIARGLAMGTGSHGQGTAMAFLEGPQQGTMAGLAMTLSGITTTLLAPLLIRLLLKA